MLITDGVEAYFALARGPSARLLEDNAAIHAAFQQAIHGSAQAFETLYRHYQPTLVRLARSKAKSAEDAEDAVQEVLMNIHAGKFSHYKIETPQGVTAVLMRSVINAVKNKNRALRGKSGTPIGDDAEAGELDPAAPERAGHLGQTKGKTTGLSEPEKKVVRGAVERALKAAKLTDKEQEFIRRVVGTGESLKDIAPDKKKGAEGDSDDEQKIASELWPDKFTKEYVDPNDKSKGFKSTGRAYARRVKERFLKTLCADPELNKLVPTGHERERGSSHLRALKAICGEDIARVAMGVVTEGIGSDPDADKVYGAVLNWISAQLL